MSTHTVHCFTPLSPHKNHEHHTEYNRYPTNHRTNNPPQIICRFIMLTPILLHERYTTRSTTRCL